jgi:hypothetical protein
MSDPSSSAIGREDSRQRLAGTGTSAGLPRDPRTPPSSAEIRANCVTTPAHHAVAWGTLSGAAWGTLIGLVFPVPAGPPWAPQGGALPSERPETSG